MARPALLLLLVAALAACGAVRQGAQYSDDAIRAARSLLGTSSDDVAIRYLDDVARTTGIATGLDDAAITWSGRVRSLEDEVQAWYAADDAARVKEFVVGATCGAMEAAEDGELTDFELASIIIIHQVASGFDADEAEAQAAARDLQDGVAELPASGNPAPLSRAIVCAAAS
jgi:hypothetical protein